MKAIYKRELLSYFTAPLGYLMMLVYFVYYGLMFLYCFKSGMPSVSSVLSSSYMVTLFVSPILTMRLFSEERKQKTDQILFTSPVSITSVVLGKFFAAFTVFAIPTLFTVVYQFIFANYVALNWTGFISALVGTILFGACLIAIGTFISSLTENQLVAAIGSLAISLLLLMLDSFTSIINISFLTSISSFISFIGRYNTFVEGIFDLSNFIFFLSFTALFNFLTIRVQESRRWA